MCNLRPRCRDVSRHRVSRRHVTRHPPYFAVSWLASVAVGRRASQRSVAACVPISRVASVVLLINIGEPSVAIQARPAPVGPKRVVEALALRVRRPRPDEVDHQRGESDRDPPTAPLTARECSSPHFSNGAARHCQYKGGCSLSKRDDRVAKWLLRKIARFKKGCKHLLLYEGVSSNLIAIVFNGSQKMNWVRASDVPIIVHGQEPDPALRRGGRKMVNRRSQEPPETPGVGRNAHTEAAEAAAS